MKLKKLLASILALAMVLSTMSTVAFAADEAKSYEVGEDKAFKNLNDALAKATEDAATNVEYHIYGAVNLEIPATHGDFDFNNATVVGKDSDAKVTVVGGGVSEITYVNMKDLTFAKADPDTFLCLKAAIEAIGKGGLYPCAVNGANERAVQLFLEDKISFTDIGRAVYATLSHFDFGNDYTLEQVYETDAKARAFVDEMLLSKGE